MCIRDRGKGVSFMENQVGWHGTAPNKEQYEQATAELQAEIDRLEEMCIRDRFQTSQYNLL